MKGRADLQILTLDDLAAVSNKLTLKRAVKDLDGGMTAKVEISPDTPDTLLVTWPDALCTFPTGGLQMALCSCPARKFCRHRVRSVLWLQKSEEEGPAAPNEPTKESASDTEEAETAEWTPAHYTLQEIKKAAGTGLWRKALKALAEGLVPAIEEDTRVSFPTLGITVRFVPAHGLAAAICNCDAPQMCVHRILGAMAYRDDLPEASPEKEPKALALRERLWTRIVEMAAVGLDGLPLEVVENIQVLAQEASDVLPGPAADLKYLGRLLRDYHNRSARFKTNAWVRALGRLGCRLDGLQQGLPPERQVTLRGAGRRSYLGAKAMKLVGVGAEGFLGRTGQVVRSWFVQEETGDVLFANVGWGGDQPARSLDSLWQGQPLWGDMTPSSLAHQRIRLLQPRRSPDGSLGIGSTTTAHVRSATETTLSLLPPALFAATKEELKTRWRSQIPVVLRSVDATWLPAVIALNTTQWSEVQPFFSEARQTLRVSVPMRDGDHLHLDVPYTPGATQTLEQMEAIHQWENVPTHMFVRFWPTTDGFVATPISVWLTNERLPRSLGLGETFSGYRRTNTNTTQPQNKQTRTPESALLSSFRQILLGLEGISVEGLARAAHWRLRELRGLGEQLQRLGLPQEGAALSSLGHQLQYPADTSHKTRAEVTQLFFRFFALMLELEERWLLR